MVKVRIYGFLFLSSFAIILLIGALYNIYQSSIIAFLIALFLASGVLIAIYNTYKVDEVLHKKDQIKDFKLFYEMLAVFLGSLVTYLIAKYLKINTVIASSAVGLVAAIFLKRYQVAIFCGSFVGMCSPNLLTILPLILASLIAATLFIISKGIFNGTGGKLGTIAFTCCLIIAFILQSPFVEGKNYSSQQILLILLVSIIGSVLTYIISVRFKRGAVFGSAIVGLIGGVLFPILFPETGTILALAIFGASFVGMTGKNKISHEALIALAGLIFGFIFIYTSTIFGGAGGKLGVSAFVSVLTIEGFIFIIKKLKINKI